MANTEAYARLRREGQSPKTLRSSIRRSFFRTLSSVEQDQTQLFRLDSVARTLGVDKSLLSHYLREAKTAGWVRTRKLEGIGIEITVLDRDSLLRASGEARSEGSVGDGTSSGGKP